MSVLPAELDRTGRGAPRQLSASALLRIGLVGACLCTLGCGRTMGRTVRPSPEVQCTPPSGAPAAGTDEANFLENRPRELQLAGLRPLLHDSLPAAVREVRLWTAASWVGVTSLVRVRAIGDSVTGELIVFAGSIIDTPPDADAVLPPACRLLGRRPGRLACAAEPRDPIDWAVVLDSLEAHRVWTLPRSSDLPPRKHMVMDGIGMDVEVRHGGCYRIYSYGNPGTETTPEYRDAAALLDILFGLRQRWAPPRP